MRITPKYLENVIDQARKSGASSGAIQELEDYLAQIRSEKLDNHRDSIFTAKTVDSEGNSSILMSTAPIYPSDKDDFADLTPKPVKKGIYKGKEQ